MIIYPHGCESSAKKNETPLDHIHSVQGKHRYFWIVAVLTLARLFRDVFEARHPSCSTVVGVFHSSQHHGPRRAAACFASKSHTIMIDQERHQRLSGMRHTDKSAWHSLWSSHPALFRRPAAGGGGGGGYARKILPQAINNMM